MSISKKPERNHTDAVFFVPVGEGFLLVEINDSVGMPTDVEWRFDKMPSAPSGQKSNSFLGWISAWLRYRP